MTEHNRITGKTTASGLVTVECRGDVFLVTPKVDMGEFVVSQLGAETEEALQQFQQSEKARHIVIDLHHTDYVGSSALGLFLRLWKRVQERGGRMALCRLSDHEREVVKIMRLNEFWAICDSLDDALTTVHG
ncbi:MAG: STAS domain-containing protein [Fuerstiella sp.]